MKRSIVYGLAVAVLAACSAEERDFQTPQQFFASLEQPGGIDTKVYATEDLLLRWNADDRVSNVSRSGGRQAGFGKVLYRT